MSTPNYCGMWSELIVEIQQLKDEGQTEIYLDDLEQRMKEMYACNLQVGEEAQ